MKKFLMFLCLFISCQNSMSIQKNSNTNQIVATTALVDALQGWNLGTINFTPPFLASVNHDNNSLLACVVSDVINDQNTNAGITDFVFNGNDLIIYASTAA